MQYVTRKSDISAGADSVTLPVRSTHCDYCRKCKHVLHCHINVNETDQIKTSDFEPL